MGEVIEGEVVEEVEPMDPPVTALAVRPEQQAMVAQDEISVEQLLAQSAKVKEAMTLAMKDGHHYGTIPGTPKPTLLKPGAEKLCVLFRLAPHYTREVIWHDDGHMTAISNCALQHIPTSLTVATGEGLCSTRESRYAYRKGERICPDCGEPQVRLGKARGDKPGNWYCWAKQGGCGASWALDSDQAKLFEEMKTDRIPNPDLADTYNTVFKMAAKRALVAAVLNGTAASEVFTQDMEDTAPVVVESGIKLVDGAPKGWANIDAALKQADPSRDWKPWADAACQAVYGVATRRDLPAATQPEYGTRLANAAAHLLATTGGNEMPPATVEEIQAAFAKAFDGHLLTVLGQASSAEEIEAALSDENHGEAALTPDEEAAMVAALENDNPDIEFGDQPDASE